MEHRLDDPVAEFTPRLPVRIDFLDETEMDDYLAFHPGRERAVIARRLRSGQSCSVAWHEDEIVSVCWTAVSPVSIDYLDCESALAGNAFLYDKFTAPSHRGQRLGQAVRVHQLRHLRASGHRRAVSVIVPENRISVLENLRSGSSTVGMLRRIKIGPWQWVSRSRHDQQ
jgi:GNAT superfamily N-acetyltransferase